MPLHYDIIYDSTTGAHSCDPGSSLTVNLVQHAIVKHNGSYVEEIDIIHSPDSSGQYPTDPFVLTLTDDSYDILPINPVVLDRDNGSTHSYTTLNDNWVVTFTVPSSNGTKLFEFGTTSGPPTKLKVKVKRVPTTYSC